MPEETSVEQAASINDLHPKMRLEGQITRTELYGAFVDLGLERDGMIHISRLANRRINKVTDRVNVGDKVTVWVTDVDPDLGRIGLTMVEPPAVDWDEMAEGQVRTGKVVRIERYGAFVDLGAERPGLLHVKQMGEYVRTPNEVVKDGETVEVRILRLDRRKRQIDLTMDVAEEPDSTEEDEEDPFLSPMEVAFRQAQGRRSRRGAGRRSGGRSRDRDDMESIYRHALDGDR
ncbi:MAG: S1 RNA-binding domain-containing protein [Anaerolineae bacterium]|nr:S1 RNA-binding domain-containing protein [Anaerolineae bacterium]